MLTVSYYALFIFLCIYQKMIENCSGIQINESSGRKISTNKYASVEEIGYCLYS